VRGGGGAGGAGDGRGGGGIWLELSGVAGKNSRHDFAYVLALVAAQDLNGRR